MLKIMTDATSPFGRKVVVAACERHLAVREVFVDMKSPEVLAPFNPLWQIPALVLSETAGLYDSMAILIHLDSLHAQAPLVRTGDAAALSMLGLADGLMEAVLARRVESVRDLPRQEPAYLARLEARIERALDVLAARLGELTPDPGGIPSGTQIAVAVALDYVDFRYGRQWRDTRAALGAWLEPWAARSAMAATAPGAREPFVSA
ncbi:glutathione S-transferase family protein [Burkholderia sp. 3C]